MAKELVGIFLGSSIAIGLLCCFRQKESEKKLEPKRHGKSDQAITLATTEGDMLPKNAKKAASLQPVSKKKNTRKGSRDKPTHVVPACGKPKEKTLHTLDATTDKDLKQSGYVVSNTVDPSRFTGTKTKPTVGKTAGKTATDVTLDKALMNDQGYEASVTCDTSQAKTAVSNQEKVFQQENGQSPLCKSEANSTYSAVLAPQKPNEEKELDNPKSPATSSKAGDADVNLANDNIGLGCGW